MDNIVGSPITNAYEMSDPGDIAQAEQMSLEKGQDSFTWTYYEIATVKGKWICRWFGQSNGYYCETPTIRRTK